MKSQFEEWGATPVADPPKESPESWGAVPADIPDPESPQAWGAVPKPATQDEINSLIADPHFEPAQYAIQSGDHETAFQARQAINNRTAGEKASAFGQTLTEPETYVNAAKGLGKFALGLVATPTHTTAQLGATIGAPIARAVGADGLANTLENEQQTQGAEATLGAQQIEQSIGGMARGARTTAQNLIGTDEATDRANFANEIEAAKNAQRLAEQRPLESGLVAKAARLAAGRGNLSEVYSPEALSAQGAREVSPLLTESMAAAADPTNLLIPMAGEIPGVKTLAGGLVQAGGKILQAPEAIMSQVSRIRRFGHGAGGLGIVGAAVTHPAAAATTGAAWGLGKVLGAAGRALDEQGAAFRTGIPSAADVTAQSAASAGTSAIGANTSRIVGNTANNVVSTVLGFAPLNYVTSGGDPRQFAQSEVGAGVMGGAFGLAGDRARLEQTARYRLAQYGAGQLAENPMWQAHQAAMAKLDPAAQAQINTLRGALFAGTGTNVLVLDGASFAKQSGDIGGNSRGLFSSDPNGGTIYLNADSIGKGGTVAAAGHESGHAIVDFLRNAGREGDAQGLFSAISKGMPADQLQAMADAYHGALARSTPAWKTGTQEEKATIEQQIREANPPEEIIEENLAEITRRILNGRDIATFALPQPILERVMDGAARFMEQRGWMPEIDPNAGLGFKAQMVKEAARRMSGVLYEVGKRASAGLDAGPSVTDQLLAARARLAGLPPITPQTPVASARAIQRQREAAQREIDELQGMLPTPATPAIPPGPPPDAAPTTPATPALNPHRIAAILRQQGLGAEEARQWAERATGATDEEAVVNVLRDRANQKFPTTKPNGPVPPPKTSEPLPPSNEGVPLGDSGNPTTTEPLEVPAKDVEGTAPPVVAPPEVSTPEKPEPAKVHTKEEFEQIAAKAKNDFLSDKAPAKAGKNKGKHTAKNQELAEKAAFDAAAQAHGETVPLNYKGMRQRVDAFGRKTVSGDLDPSRPFDAWLIDRAEKSGNLPAGTLETIKRLQDAIGTTVTFDYGHAPVAEEGEQPTGESRAGQQAQHTVKKRLSGESPMQTEAKTSIPLSVGFNSGTNSFTIFGASPEKLLNNFNHIAEAMGTIGQAVPYRDINDPQLVADIKAVIRNHQNGWQGDGSRPAIGTAEYPNVANPDWATSPERTQIPEDRFQFVNMMLGDEGAKTQNAQGKAKAHLANENRRMINEAGETNELRQKINDSLPWTDKDGNAKSWSSVNLEDPLNENVSPSLASNVREASQSDESIRQHGKVGDLGRFFEKGQTPNRAKTAAGFLPAEEAELKDVRSSTAVDSRRALNSAVGKVMLKPETVPIDSLNGGVRLSDPGEKTKVSALASRISGPNGYYERIIADQNGDVFEGQHRLEALRQLGIKNVPITRMSEVSDSIPNASEIVDSLKGLRREQAQQIVDNIGEIVAKEGASALDEYEPPKGYETQWNKAVEMAKKSASGFMPEDTSKPEDGGTAPERLAREAEQAGVMLSMSTIRGLMREDPETMGKIRARIALATGKPARFLPNGDSLSKIPSSSSGPRINRLDQGERIKQAARERIAARQGQNRQ